MTKQEPGFLLDIRVELSNAFSDEYEVTAKSENLFEISLINLTQNTNKAIEKDNKIKTIKSEMKKKILSCSPCGYKQYGTSILLTTNATEIISKMKKQCLELYIKSKTNSDREIGTMFIPWTKTLIHYIKNIKSQPRLPPVAHKEKLNVVNSKNNVILGSINVTFKLMSLASNFYEFITGSKKNIKMYSNLLSNPKVIEKQDSKYNGHRKNSTIINDTPVMIPCNNRSDITYNVIESTEKNLFRPAINAYIENYKDEKNKTSKILRESEFTVEERFKESDKDIDVLLKNKTYCINYFTFSKESKNVQPEIGLTEDFLEKSESSTKLNPIKHQEDKVVMKALTGVNFKSDHSSGSKPGAEASILDVTNCHNLDCDPKMRRSKISVYDNSLALDLSTLNDQCCRRYEQKSSANLKFDEHPCYCTCECKFEFIRETTYCKICGGYEVIGEEFVDARGQEMPMPCPIFHKLVDKNKLKSRSSSGSIRRRKGDGSSKSIKSSKSTRSSTPKTSEKHFKVPEKKVVQQKSTKEFKKKKVVQLKQIDYSYKSPHVGHGDCVYPCTRSAILKCNVPKSMGWFWTADNVHGLPYRPKWRPGAAENHVVNLLQMARHHKQIISKKKKKDLVKVTVKRPLKRPLLVVHKKDGEFTVTMETMKTFTKPREVFEHPYEDKPAQTYTIGRTDEENREREKQKLRKQRRLEREQRTYLQSAFKNVCQEICLKTCQQALGILPEAEDKQGLCYTNATWVDPENPNPSCSCSENALSTSDTDSGEWILEFTPPNAFFDPLRKGKNIDKTEQDTQYIPPLS